MLKLYSNRTGNVGSLKQGDTIIQISPLSFLRSGDYNYDSGSLYGRTSLGTYWSGRFYPFTDSYNLGFGSTALDPQYGSDRGYGFSVRCLARQPCILALST